VNNEHTYNAVAGRLAKLRDSPGEDETRPTVPASEIIARASRRRVRRLVSGMTGVLALAAVAVFTVTALLPASHRASNLPALRAHAQLAAWTVVKEANGTVFVKIRELRDPAGLQGKLRADGIPASVQFYPGNPVGKSPLAIVQFKGNPCREYAGGRSQNNHVVTGRHPLQSGFTIHPSAIPSGAGMQLVASRNLGYYSPHHPEPIALFEWLVQPSPQCTGS
jgi:hypothetical protein